MFLRLSKVSKCDGTVAIRSFNLLCCGNEWPMEKVSLVEGREEYAKRFFAFVLQILVMPLIEPSLLIPGTSYLDSRGVR